MPLDLTFSTFAEGEFTYRYEFDRDNYRIRDTKFNRNLEAKCRRGARPYFRLVDDASKAHHVRAEDIFGEAGNDLVKFAFDFDPAEFTDRYTFDFAEGSVLRKKGRGPNSGKPMTLLSPGGWKHYLLTDNSGQRRRITPAEIKECASRESWTVPCPKGAVTIPQFPHHAFTKDGQILRLHSTEQPLLSPEPLAVDTVAAPGSKDPDEEVTYVLRSASGQKHRFSRATIKRAVAQSKKR